MSRFKKKILSITCVAAVFMLMGGFILRERAYSKGLERQINAEYSYSFSQLTGCMEELADALKKITYASSPSMLASVCTEAYAKASAAQAAMVGLPYSDAELEHTAAFVTKAGDYAAYLVRASAAGHIYTPEERANVVSLAASAHRIAQTLTGLNAGLLDGSVSIRELEQSQDILAQSDDSAADSAIMGSFKEMETKFPELPTLIYDGPFSEHLKKASPALLKGEAEITEDEALKTASDFTGMPADSFTVEYVRDSDIPVYAISASLSHSSVNFEITRQGGFVLYYGYNRPVSASLITPEQAVKKAESFLKSRKISSMRTTYYTLQGNVLLINFAYEQDGVICYPDLVKVSVAMDNGGIVGFESTGYVMCHTMRDIPGAETDEETAAERVAPNLKVLSHSMAVIPTSGKNEVYCHEFKCEDGDGAIYVNALTGVEENILLLIEDENGTLTL